MKILDCYYRRGLRKYTTSKDIIDSFGISYDQLINHLLYLKEKKFLSCVIDSGPSGIARCRITALGIDAIEFPEKFVQDFPALSLTIQGDVINSHIFQARNIQIVNGFNRVYEAINELDLSKTDKNELKEKVDELKIEADKEKIDNNKIKLLLEFIKLKSPNIYDIIKPIIVEIFKKAIGLD